MTRAMTRDDILTAFELLLDRAPAPAHLDQMLAQGITLPQLRRMILGSEEFCEIHAALRAQPAGPVPSRAGLPALVHLHIPKTAGTSLNRKLMALYPPQARIDAYSGDPTQRLMAMPAPERAQIRLVAGHCAHGIGTLLSGPVQYLCLLRDPAARLLSYYRFIMRNPIKPSWHILDARRPAFGEFLQIAQADLPDLWRELDNGQVRRLAGRMNAPEVDQSLYDTACTHLAAPDMIFGVMEDFGATLHRLEAMGLLRDAQELHANTAPQATDPAEARLGLTPDQEALLDHCLAWDQQFYDYGCQLLAQRKDAAA